MVETKTKSRPSASENEAQAFGEGSGLQYNPSVRSRSRLFLAGFAGLTWAGLVGLIFMLNVGDYSFWFPGRIAAYVLLIIAPALTFIPIGKALEFPSYGYWGVVSFALFGYIVAFVPSEPERGWNANIVVLALLLISLFMVAVTITLPLFYKLGFKLFTRRVEQYDLARARREAVLFGSYILLVAFLRMVGGANLLNTLALLGVFIILELLILTRRVGRW